MTATPPRAAERPQRRTLHGVELVDPYAWLRDPDWQRVMREPEALQPEIRAHLEAENAWTESALAATDALQEALFTELRARIKEEDDAVPEPDGPWEYFRRHVAGGEHPLFCRRRRADGREEILLDGNEEAAGLAYFQVRSAHHSPDHRIFAYAVDSTGSEYCEVRFRDLDSGALLPDRLADCNGSFQWAADGRTLFYVVLDENHRPWRIFRHRLGRPAGEDVLVYEERDPGFFLGLGLTASRRYLLIQAHDHTTSEVHLLDARDPTQPPRLVQAREADLRYDLEHDAPRERFLILTNAGGAEDFKLMEAPEDAPGRANWREVLAHRPGCLRLGFELFRDHMVLLEREAGLPRLVVTRLHDGASHSLAFEEAAYALALSPGYEYETTRLRFVYSSLATPQRTYDYDMQTRSRALRKEQEIPSGHDPAAYRVERCFAPAPDGETVPISLLYRKDRRIDGTAPLLLYGYGSYGIAIPASFVPNRFSLVDRGFVYAIAHVRGGTDKGWRWYRHGKLKHKPNSFSDFIACARYLIEAGYTRAGNIAIQGGSAGGLLVGAVLNQAPDLFRAAVAEVPFVDVLNTMCDASLPLTPPEWKEWGNPLEDADAFATIRGYSPYDNIKAQAYPHILATAGLTDPRVTYWEPAKWVARLRAMKTDDNLLLLKTYMEAGHAGAAGRFDKLREVALAYAFLLLVCEPAG